MSAPDYMRNATRKIFLAFNGASTDVKNVSDFAMESGPLTEVLIEQIDLMPPQLQQAARFVLDRPRDVALMSMREQAQAAGVSHTTMMRLARWIHLKGYEDVRGLYADALRLAYMDRDIGTRLLPDNSPLTANQTLADAHAGPFRQRS